MNNDKTAFIKKITENALFNSFLKSLTPFLIAAVMGLTAWMWNTSLNIADIQRTIDEEDSQWELIKENTDDFWEVRLRLGILEYATGIDGHIEQEGRQSFDIDDMLRQADEEMKNRKGEGVDQWKMMQQQTK